MPSSGTREYNTGLLDHGRVAAKRPIKTGRTRQPVNARPGERTVRPQMRLGNGYELPDERRGPVVATRMAAAPHPPSALMRVFAGSEHMVIAGDQRTTVGEATAPGDRLHAAARIHDLLRKTKILHGRGGTVPMSTASAGTWRLSVRYRRIDSASDTTSSLPCPPAATNTPVLPCFSHNGRRQQRRQRRQRHAEIHSGLPHQSSSSRRCAETRHYTAEPAAVPLTPVAIHHRLFPRHVRCPIIVDLSYSHASGTPPRPHACTVQEGFPYGTELSRVAGNRHRDHRVRPQARCDPDHHRG